jgi:glutamyl-tRNA synthetase
VALFNLCFARQHGGQFILRIEDTDQMRSTAESEQDILNALRWLGLNWDEGPDVGGPHGPYRQSERRSSYGQYAEDLVTAGHAFYCFRTPEELDVIREERKAKGLNPGIKGDLELPQEEVKRRLDAGDPYVIRMKVPDEGVCEIQDMLRGTIEIDWSQVDCQILLKSDGMPTYHLANVVDDHTMEITHVIRGEEWLSSAPKHILLYNAFGWEPPTMAHLPLIMSPSGGKLSKRKAESEGIPINTKDYISGHYEPDALVNFLAYLGWSPGDDSEIHDMKALSELFTLDRVSKGGAVFNHKKLMWYNENYIREHSIAELKPRVKVLMEAEGFEIPSDEFLTKVIELLHERVSKVDEFVSMGAFFFEAPESYDEKALKKWKDDSPVILKTYRDKIEVLPEQDFEAVTLKDKIKETIEEHEVGFGKLMMPLRLAVSGQGFGPDLTPALELIGKPEVLARIDTIIEKLG